MLELTKQLNKRRVILFYLIALFSILAIFVDYTFTVSPLEYFGLTYKYYIIYGLIVYKLIELPILYYILLHKHLAKIQNKEDDRNVFKKLEKQSKVLFFLIIQGNTIFGIIAYKLSVDILYFLLFMLIALITTILIKPNKLFS